MVNQNKIFLFKIKRKTKNLFSSDVERTIEADVTLFEWFESKDTNGFRRWQERLTLVPKEWQHICNYIEFKMLYRVIRDVILNTRSTMTFFQCICDVFTYLLSTTNLSSYEPQREKTYLLICAHNEYSNQSVHPSMFVVRMTKRHTLGYQKLTSEDSDQTARMRSLIWIFAGHT